MTDRPTTPLRETVERVKVYTESLTGKQVCDVCGLYPLLQVPAPCPDGYGELCLVAHYVPAACPVCQRLTALQAELREAQERYEHAKEGLWMTDKRIALGEAEVGRLQAENDALRHQWAQASVEAKDHFRDRNLFIDTCEALRAENARLREDAARLESVAREAFVDGAGWATGKSTKAASDEADRYAAMIVRAGDCR